MKNAFSVASGSIVALLAATVVLTFVAVGFAPHSNTRAVQTIYVHNESSFVSDAEVRNDMPAFQKALSGDFAPVWQVDAKLVFVGSNGTTPKGAIVIHLIDRPDIPNALAYHYVKDGVPYAKIFIGTSRYYGYSWTVALTHELWEMLVDPVVVRTEQSPDGRIWAGEVADPVEADSLGYTRKGANGKPVLISDFITEKWFGAEQVGDYDFAHHVQDPLAILKDGYAQYWNGVGWVAITNWKAGRTSLYFHDLDTGSRRDRDGKSAFAEAWGTGTDPTAYWAT